MLCSQQCGKSLALRVSAALLLLVWVCSLSVCSTECLCHQGRSQSEHMDQADKGHSDDSDRSDHHDDSFCNSLRSTCLTSTAESLVKPDFVFFVLNSTSVAQGIDNSDAESPFSRQPPDRKWVFTPEVCLGPALRCHAPPFSSWV